MSLSGAWEERRKAVSRAVGDRKLVWFGIRGIDAGPLLAVEQFSDSYAITARMEAAGLRESIALEDATGRRMDLDRYDIDDDPSADVRRLRRTMLASLTAPAVLMAYRPAAFLSSVYFPNLERTRLATLFVEQQRPFEHKPWVEVELRRAGVPTIPWRYVSDEDHLFIDRWLREGPVVVRPSRTSGGVGLVLVEDGGQATIEWPRERDAFIAVAPFYRDSVPVNVGACAFPDGSVSVHAPSVQLIGLPECTTQRFGYCGNDFGAIAGLSRSALSTLDDLVRTTGRWLASRSYVGAFGVDALVLDDHVVLTEVNPRFQGSSLLGAELARSMEVPDLYLDHLAAFLGLGPAGPGPTIPDWAAAGTALAHVVVHNRRPDPVHLSEPLPGGGFPERGRAELVPPRHVRVEPGGILCRVRAAGRITDTGNALRSGWQQPLVSLQERFTTGRLERRGVADVAAFADMSTSKLPAD